MSGIDAVTWQALGLVLTLIGLGASYVVWKQRGRARGLRAAAWSLLPLAAGLTGTLKLAGEVADAVVRWAGRFVFSPTVWVGLAVAGVAAGLFVVSGRLLRRDKPADRAARADRAAGKQPPAVTGGRSAPAASAPAESGFEDIEAILRKHGIS